MAAVAPSTPDAPVVVVTGSSVGGIGGGLVESFANRGCTVYATSRRLETMQGLKSNKGNIVLKALDVTDEAMVNKIIDEIVAEAGRIDIFINNAGTVYVQPATELNTADAKNLFEINFWGSVYCTKAVARHMIPVRKGKVLMISSVAGEVSGPFASIYNASKFAMRAYSDAARLELRPFNVDVVIVNPGVIKSRIGVNNKDSLANWDSTNSMYKDFAVLVQARVQFDIDQTDGTPTDEFCDYVTNKIMPYSGSKALVVRPVGPLEIFKGKISTTVWILRMLPRGVCDWFFFRFSGLAAVWDSLKKNGWK